MAIQYLNGFGTIPAAGDFVVAVAAPNGVSTLSRQTGRNGGYALRHSNTVNSNQSSYSGSYRFYPASGLGEFSLGFAVNHLATHSGSHPTFGLSLDSDYDIGIGCGFSNSYANGPYVTAWTIEDNSVIGTGWHWYNWVYKAATTGGISEFWRDGIRLAYVNTDTMPYSGIPITLSMANGNNNGGVKVDIADVIWKNDASVIPDTTVISLFPDGTTAAGLVGSDGDSINNHLLVNENPTYDPATYVGSVTPGATDTYTMSNLPAITGIVTAVQASTRAFKSDAGAKTMSTLINSTERAPIDPGGGSTIYQLTTTDGGTVWDTTKVNNVTVGIKVIS